MTNVSVLSEIMELYFTPEQQAQIAHIADKTGTDPEHLVKTAVMRLLEEERDFGPVPELPVLHLGPMKSLHRRDIYDDVG